MASLDTLALLIEKATEEKNLAAQNFAVATQRRQKGQQKLELLINYRREYEDMLYKKTQQGISGTEVNNYNRFIKQLSEAIIQQEQELVKLQEYEALTRTEFAEAEKKLKSFEILEQRERNKILQKESIREQKATDEFANRKAAVSDTNPFL